MALLFLGPVPQDPHYHCFADDRVVFGVANFWNVVTNLPFLLVGGWGLIWMTRNANQDDLVVRIMYFVCFLGILLTCFGSSWYHLDPNNDTLLWDRLPMTLVFMAFFSIILYDYVGRRLGGYGFWTLLLLGLFSVFYWYYREQQGHGDLRVYMFVQFFPILFIPIVLLINRGVTMYRRFVLWIFIFYALAKLTEIFDTQVYDALGEMSGHAIKHVFAGVAAFYIYKMIGARAASSCA